MTLAGVTIPIPAARKLFQTLVDAGLCDAEAPTIPWGCPSCGSTESEVTDSRPAASWIRRSRRCRGCGGSYTTREQVVMDNGRRDRHAG